MDTTTIIIYVLMFAAFIALMIIPQKRRQKKLKEMMDSLSLGDSISTIGGICGEIIALRGDTVIIRTGRENMEMELLRQAIAAIRQKAGSTDLEVTEG